VHQIVVNESNQVVGRSESTKQSHICLQ